MPFPALEGHALREGAAVHNAAQPFRALPWALWERILRGVDEDDLARMACATRFFAALADDCRAPLEAAWDAARRDAARPAPTWESLWFCSRCFTEVNDEGGALHALECGHLLCDVCSRHVDRDWDHEYWECRACDHRTPFRGDILPVALICTGEADEDIEDVEGGGGGGGEEAPAANSAEQACAAMAMCMVACSRSMRGMRGMRAAAARLRRRASALLAIVHRIPCGYCEKRACDPTNLRSIGTRVCCTSCSPAFAVRREPRPVPFRLAWHS